MTNGAPSGPVTIRRAEPYPERGDVNVGGAERLTSVIAGAAMTLYGLKKMSPSGLVLILSGGALIYRGLSGRCAVYEQLGINTATTPSDAEL